MSLYLMKNKTFKARTWVANGKYHVARWKVSVNRLCLLESMMENCNNKLLLRGDLWQNLDKLLKKKPCPFVYTRFREHIRVSTYFLADMSKEGKVELEMTVEYEDKKWNFDFTINSKGVGVMCKKLDSKLKAEFREALYSGEAKTTFKLNFRDVEPLHRILPHDQTAMVSRKLLDLQIQSDVQLVAQNGMKFPCHKAFLAGHSAWFDHLFRMQPEEKIWKFDMTEVGLRAFLKYVYYADTEVPKNNLGIALELLKIGRKYNITLVEKGMQALILEIPTSSLGVETSLRLFCLTRKEKGLENLRAKAIKLMKWNLTKVSESYTLQSIVKGEGSDTIAELDSIGLYK